jgi:hypothetical protein
MPTWRKFHVKTTDSLDLNDMPDDFTRLMWCLLPLKSCREGRGIDLPQWVMAQLFPLRSDVTLEQVENAMRWFQGRGMIKRYGVSGRPYYQIENWHIYQGTTDREAKSPYPAPEYENGTVEKKKIQKDIDIDACQNTNSRLSQELVRTSKITNQELPPEARPNYQHNESRRLIISALSSVCRETFVIGDEKQERAADALIELGATEADIIAFGPYWAKVEGKPYNGKPYLKSLMQNIKESMESKGAKPTGARAVNPDGSVGYVDESVWGAT